MLPLFLRLSFSGQVMFHTSLTFVYNPILEVLSGEQTLIVACLSLSLFNYAISTPYVI